MLSLCVELVSKFYDDFSLAIINEHFKYIKVHLINTIGGLFSLPLLSKNKDHAITNR